MPRMKKKVDASVTGPPPSNLSQSLTAGRSRRTIKPNPRYLNDEMVVPSSKGPGGSFDGSDMSEDDYEMEEDELDELMVRKSMVASSTPQLGTVPKRRGRPPRPRPLEAPRTEPIKNLRKEVLKKMDYKTISMNKSRQHMGTPMMRDGRRKLAMSLDSVESDSADQDDMDEMEDKLDQSSDGGENTNQSQRVLNPAAFKKHLVEKTILERRGSGTHKSSTGSKRTAGTTEDEEDDEDFYNDSEAKVIHTEQVVPAKRPVGRPRKHPIKQQISPFARKVLLPGMKNAIGSSQQSLKRKGAPTDSDDDTKHESQQSKMLRRSYGLKHVNSQNQSMETESDENEANDSDDGKRKALQRARSFPSLPRGPGRGGKNAYHMNRYKQKMVDEAARKASDKLLNSPTITYVSVKDIMKKSKSSSDIRRKMEQEEDSDEGSEMEELQSVGKEGASPSGDRPKTHNQLVATILERKRPIALENVQDARRRLRTIPSEALGRKKREMQGMGKHQRGRDLGVTEILTENDIVDFEDMLQKNIVSANKTSRVAPDAPAHRGRGRPSENSHPNATNASGGGNKANNLYKAGRPPLSRQSGGRGMGLRRSLQPPRILNSTMKLGDGRALSKLSATSGNNHYSIDLADPDNNVKLVASAENSPVKRPLPTVGAGGALRTVGNVPRAGMLRAENQHPPSDPKKRKVTCYEKWHVINCKFSDSPARKQSIAMTMIGLGNIAGSISMPSEAWSLRTVLEKRKTPPNAGDEIFTGEMQDNAISDEDKANYEPNRIMFRRKAPTPGRFNVQYDRTVIFLNECYMVNIDGQSCRLVAAPFRLDSVEDIEQLLSIVDYIDLQNGCVEVISPIRSAADAGAAAYKRLAAGRVVTV